MDRIATEMQRVRSKFAWAFLLIPVSVVCLALAILTVLKAFYDIGFAADRIAILYHSSPVVAFLWSYAPNVEIAYRLSWPLAYFLLLVIGIALAPAFFASAFRSRRRLKQLKQEAADNEVREGFRLQSEQAQPPTPQRKIGFHADEQEG